MHSSDINASYMAVGIIAKLSCDDMTNFIIDLCDSYSIFEELVIKFYSILRINLIINYLKNKFYFRKILFRNGKFLSKL
jgi:hypothetical protein